MKIIAVDDEILMLDALTRSIREAAPDAEVAPFRKPSDALTHAGVHRVDVAFLDIRMRGMDGLELGRRLMELHPNINLIFVTSFDEYIPEAFRSVRCNGYITKPVDAEQVAKELSHLRLPMKISKRVRATCLGRFEVFVDGQPVKFENTKTKELLACLIDAEGGVVPNQELIAKLWEDDNRHESYFKKIRKDLYDTLQAMGCSDIIHIQRGGLGIVTGQIDCDYYTWKQRNPGQKPQIYMAQYTWANPPLYEL